MKARNVCAVLGVAIAVGAVVFMRSLVATNDAQAERVAERLLEEVRVPAGTETLSFELDYRPDGRVMQGPPMRATVAVTDMSDIASDECVVTAALFAQRKLPVPPTGTELTFLGQKSVTRLKLAAVLPWSRPVRGYPNVFVTPEAASGIPEPRQPFVARTAEELAPLFKSDAERNFDRAKALLLWGAALTALCLLVNTLFLTVEARRKELALLRVLGLTRTGVVRRVAVSALGLATAGYALGTLGGVAALGAYVGCDPATYPQGVAIAGRVLLPLLAVTLTVALLAALIALRPALAVRPLEAASARSPRRRPLGMMVSFACGFGAFVAVEVWGSSLMSAFVPSPEWPDAIVSILPQGVSSFAIEKLKSLPHVRRIAELQPLQVNLDPLVELPAREGSGSPRGRGPAYHNALLLASDWLPDFRFVVGSHEAAEKALASGDNCVITEMMARAKGLSLGDSLRLDCGRGFKLALTVVGVVDLNWHMVTSRGLVRGLNRMPVHTDGSVFVSFDTLMACDARPQEMVKMTHLWLDYEPDFLSEKGAFEAGRVVEREIAQELDAPENTVRLHSRDEIADGTLARGAELIGAMARVPFVFLAVASLGFIAMLVGSVESRRHAFRVLRAVGATRGQLAGVLVGEALRVAATGGLIGLVGGAAVGWLATAGTRAAMVAWGLPASFAVPWPLILEGFVGAGILALAVVVPTAFHLVRSPDRASFMI